MSKKNNNHLPQAAKEKLEGTPMLVVKKSNSTESTSNSIVNKLKDNTFLQSEIIHDLIAGHDVVLFGKAGCGYCEKAKEALDEFSSSSAVPFTFKVYNVVGNPEISRNDAATITKLLRSKLGLFDLTFPQIVVNGYYIGGADDLIELINNKEFDAILGDSYVTLSESGKINWYPPLEKDAANPKLLQIATMKNTWYPHWPWYTFQWVMYSNMIRYISILHIIFMVVALTLLQTEYYSAGNVILWILTFDLIMFTILGPSPWSFTGTASYYFLWKIRGNATSTIPYKLVYTIYITKVLSYLLKESNQPPDSINVNSISRFLCFATGNSVLLAVFRF